jgi:hypothetical protein
MISDQLKQHLSNITSIEAYIQALEDNKQEQLSKDNKMFFLCIPEEHFTPAFLEKHKNIYEKIFSESRDFITFLPQNVNPPSSKLDVIAALTPRVIDNNLKYLALDYLKDVDLSKINDDSHDNIKKLKNIKQTSKNIHSLMQLAIRYLAASLVVALVLTVLWLTLGTTAFLFLPGTATLNFGALAASRFFQAKTQQKKLDTICSAKPE